VNLKRSAYNFNQSAASSVVYTTCKMIQLLYREYNSIPIKKIAWK